MNSISNLENQIDLGRTPELDRTTKIEDQSGKSLSPTETACAELHGSYHYFNSTLFDSELPDCMLTMDMSHRSALGYFSPERFAARDGQIIDQIAINPNYILSQPFKEVAGTLVHEMAHLWMHRCSGKKVTSGYHCRRWGRKMESVGLIPSATGKPGGKKTGYRMSDYPEPNGRFEQAVNVMLENGFAITWGALTAEMRQELSPSNPSIKGGVDGNVKPREKTKGKVKFVCPVCQQACWGAASLSLVCGNDNQALIRATKA